MGEPPGAGGYRARRERRALSVLEHVLGPRIAVLGHGAPGFGRADLVVRVAAPPCEPAGVAAVGAPDAVPLASGAFTGVLLAGVLPAGDAAGAVLAEAHRLLQPGGFVLVLDRVSLLAEQASAPSYADLAARLRGAGLEPGRRIACHGTPSWIAERAESGRLPRLLWGLLGAIERMRWRVSPPEEITCVVAAQKGGGFDVDYPDARRVMGGLFVPPRWLERRRGR